MKTGAGSLVLNLGAMLLASALGGQAQAQAQAQTQPQNGAAAAPARVDALILEAQDALRLKDRKRLQALSLQAQQSGHALAPWVDYWQLGLRLAEVGASEVEAFYARWPGSYVEDRLRNDWLLELGRRRDWPAFARDYPRFQMRDDREVSCFALLSEHLAGRPVREAARQAWLGQRDGGDGCQLLASTLLEARLLAPADLWLKLRLSVEALRPRAIKQTAALLGKPVEQALAELQDKPGSYLARKARSGSREQSELATLALMRLAAADPEQAATLMRSRWERALPKELAAWAWAQIGRQAAFKLQGEASDYFEQALKLQGKNRPDWSEDTVAWIARAGLRSARWYQTLKALDLMEAASEAKDGRELPPWPYWRARALLATAAPGPHGAPLREEARGLLQSLAQAPQAAFHYYGRLAAEELGLTPQLPPAPLPLSPAERAQAQANPGLQRALLLIAAGLRNEGNREWNFSLRGLNDRELRAAAQEACEREIWDRCINTSDRSRSEFDLAQRYPTPFRSQLTAKTREVGIDPAYVYGLIRQESRFVLDARSAVGASGLMQVMPATARWTAKKVGLAYNPELLKDRDFNLKIGASYLKLVLDDFAGSYAMAAAAYNAGPGRPRRWREGPLLDAAIWAENIPFLETRDYVKKVLTHSTVYAQLLGQGPEASSLRARLGRTIGPRESGSSQLPEEASQP